MIKIRVVLPISAVMVLVSLGGEGAWPQSRVGQQQTAVARPGDAEVLGVQEVGIDSWKPEPSSLPLPEDLSIQVNRKVELAPGPEKPGNLPENEDHRGIQVKVDNP